MGSTGDSTKESVALRKERQKENMEFHFETSSTPQIIGGVLSLKQKPIKTPSIKSKAASVKSSLKSKTPAANKSKGKSKGVATEDAVVPFDRAG